MIVVILLLNEYCYFSEILSFHFPKEWKGKKIKQTCHFIAFDQWYFDRMSQSRVFEGFFPRTCFRCMNFKKVCCCSCSIVWFFLLYGKFWIAAVYSINIKKKIHSWCWSYVQRVGGTYCVVEYLYIFFYVFSDKNHSFCILLSMWEEIYIILFPKYANKHLFFNFDYFYWLKNWKFLFHFKHFIFRSNGFSLFNWISRESLS